MRAEDVRVVDAGEAEGGAVALDEHGFVEEHLHAHAFEDRHVAQRVVVAEHAVERRGEDGGELGHLGEGGVVHVDGEVVEVAGDDGDVVGEALERLRDDGREVRVEVEMEIAQVEDGEALERGRESGHGERVVADDGAEKLAVAAPPEAGGLHAEGEHGLEEAHRAEAHEAAELQFARVLEQDAAAVEARAHAPPDAPPLRLGHAVHGGSAATSGSWAPRA